MNIAVAGTGYVGLSIATLLAQHQHVTAVDVVKEKVEMLKNHISPIKDEYVELTYKEYELLKLLLANAGIVTTRDKILERIWGTDYEGESRTLDMHVKTLRQKLKSGGALIKTVRNVGYILSKEV